MAKSDPAPVTGLELQQAEARIADRRKVQPYAVAARYDRRIGRIVVRLSNDLELTFPPRLAQGLETAGPDDLADIAISPAGLGLHFPRLDADLYVPALLEGLFGSERWEAARMGRSGGQARSAAKTEAARINGKRGGRPANAALPRDIERRPEAITPLSPALVARITALTKGMEIDPADEINGDVDL
ncbi:MAG: DUF2442 domain-containing protein [Bosea sp. (in: a-proteobacteria)]